MAAPAPAKETKVETPALEEQIRSRAYEIYVLRGYQDGRDVDDWLQAEKEMTQAQQDARVDEALKESFPSSDAPAY